MGIESKKKQEYAEFESRASELIKELQELQLLKPPAKPQPKPKRGNAGSALSRFEKLAKADTEEDTDPDKWVEVELDESGKSGESEYFFILDDEEDGFDYIDNDFEDDDFDEDDDEDDNDDEDDDSDDDDNEPEAACVTPDPDYSDTILLIGTTRLGKGRKKQGRALMRSFLYALSQMTTLPRTIILFNSGVKLALRSSHSRYDLIDLEARGTEVLVCGSSLEAYDVKDKLAVGKVTTMYDITERIIGGDPVVTLS